MASGLLEKLLVRTLAVAFACSTTTGCLALQDQPYIGDFPLTATVNHPPVILESLVEPQRPGGGEPLLVKTGLGCPDTITFRVRVYDTDVKDLLSVRWFVDYDAKTNNGYEFDAIDPQPAPDPETAPSAVRNVPAEFEAKLGSGSGLGKPGFHLVEAMVSDRREFTTREEPFTPPQPGEVGAPSPRTTYAWFVRTEDASCP